MGEFLVFRDVGEDFWGKQPRRESCWGRGSSQGVLGLLPTSGSVREEPVMREEDQQNTLTKLVLGTPSPLMLRGAVR